MRTSLCTWNSLIQESSTDNNSDRVKPELSSQESMLALESVSDLDPHEQAPKDSESGNDVPDDEPGSHEQ